ncbi:MAG: ornithine cyclodeaminase family protein [Chloroflexota bacterium]
MLLLSDEDVLGHVDMPTAIRVIRTAFEEQAAGTLVAPPRHSISSPNGKLVFTAGAATGKRDDNANVIGFRVYPAFMTGDQVVDDQMVVVYNADNGALKGVITGRYLGALRTGAINGIAAEHMARRDAEVLSVIGAGFQAMTQVQAVMAARPNIEKILIYSRTKAVADDFKQSLEQQFNASIQVLRSPESAVQTADILITATSSKTPVIDEDWIKPGTHINSIGPKFNKAHELPKDINRRIDLLVTDSLAQIHGYDRPYFLGEHVSMLGLEKLVVGSHPGRESDEEITLFSSVGLAGTEVVLANYLIDKFAQADT